MGRREGKGDKGVSATSVRQQVARVSCNSSHATMPFSVARWGWSAVNRDHLASIGPHLDPHDPDLCHRDAHPARPRDEPPRGAVGTPCGALAGLAVLPDPIHETNLQPPRRCGATHLRLSFFCRATASDSIIGRDFAFDRKNNYICLCNLRNVWLKFSGLMMRLNSSSPTCCFSIRRATRSIPATMATTRSIWRRRWPMT